MTNEQIKMDPEHTEDAVIEKESSEFGYAFGMSMIPIGFIMTVMGLAFLVTNLGY